MRALIVIILSGALMAGAMAWSGPHIKQAGKDWRMHQKILRNIKK